VTEARYEYEVGEKGQEGLDILDVMFNQNTQNQIRQAGLTPEMRVLDIGCGRGAMSIWLANEVGNKGSVLAIDNSENQIKATIALLRGKQPPSLSFKVFSAHDIHKLNQSFDMVYCRFILHHVQHPTDVIQKVYDLLPQGGIFVAEEGLVSAAFSYPLISGWGEERLKYPLPNETEEHRDGNFGMKLFHQMSMVGFKIKSATLYQPLLYTQEQKKLLLQSLDSYKQWNLDHGMNIVEWNKRENELRKLIENKNGCIGFYQSCLVVGQK
jgi:ubiquinone/menaquinone biosynthesis C-methylase UbiE